MTGKARKPGGMQSVSQSVSQIAQRAERIAQAQEIEIVEITLQKESRGKCLCIYADKKGGISLNDCERFHKELQPLLEDIDYDIMEVSSPGLDRPVKTLRDFEKKRGSVVEVHLFAPKDGQKRYRGILDDMTEETVTLLMEDGVHRLFERKGVSLIKPVIELDEADFADVDFDENNAEEINEIEM